MGSSSEQNGFRIDLAALPSVEALKDDWLALEVTWGTGFAERLEVIADRRLDMRIRMLGGTHIGAAGEQGRGNVVLIPAGVARGFGPAAAGRAETPRDKLFGLPLPRERSWRAAVVRHDR